MIKAITFTGGLGAQIVSAAGYFYLQSKFEPVKADLSYFLQPYHEAQPGVKGDVSHWSWELGSYGLHFESFAQVDSDAYEFIWDGPEKVRLAFLGLAQPEIRKKFPISLESVRFRNNLFGSDSYACVHIRRGDYLNVASFIVDDDSIFRIMSKVQNFVKNVLVISETALSDRMIVLTASLKCNVTSVIGGDPSVLHGVMRLSDILISANSQFSLTAASLRDEAALSFLPSQHDGPINSYLNTYLSSIREFQIVTKT